MRITKALLEMLARRAPRARFFFKLLAPAVHFGFWALGLYLSP